MIVSEPESFTFRGEGVALTCSWRRWEIKLLSGFTKKLLNYISCTNVFFTYRRLILWQLELYELLNIKNGLCHMFTKAWRLKELNWTDITYIEVSECCSWSHVICGHQIFLNQPFSRYSIAGTFPQHQFCILLKNITNLYCDTRKRSVAVFHSIWVPSRHVSHSVITRANLKRGTYNYNST